MGLFIEGYDGIGHGFEISSLGWVSVDGRGIKLSLSLSLPVPVLYHLSLSSSQYLYFYHSTTTTKMQFKNLFLATSAITAVTALPAATESQSKTFNLVAIHSGSSVQYAGFNAAKSSLFAGLSSQNASCARPNEQTATFYIQDGALYLYDQSATPQEFYVDRSGMGTLCSFPPPF